MTEAAVSDLLEADCHHVAPGDGEFAARMRVHQSWYRRQILALPPGAHARAKGALYGNILRDEDARRGANFLNAAVHEVAETRILQAGGAIDAGRLRGNMLSSQPFCFNLFGYLSTNLNLATRLLRELPGVPSDLHVRAILLEYAPAKRAHLDDNSAFDAFVEYSRPDGVRGFLGIETKLVEPFSQSHVALSPRYARWLGRAGSWWQPGAEGEFSNPAYNQLWRNHLLAYAMLNSPDANHQEGTCVVLHPAGDRACSEALRAYRGLLTPAGDSTLAVWQLEETIGVWRTILQSERDRAWLDALSMRYAELDLSQRAWDSVRPARFSAVRS
ncbi:MAG: PGN_0703 family putative restriction endonuclease [Caldilineaceae bacterium]